VTDSPGTETSQGQYLRITRSFFVSPPHTLATFKNIVATLLGTECTIKNIVATLRHYVQIERWVYDACMHTSMSKHLHTAYVNISLYAHKYE
jgi:hypothetical protein